MVKFKCVLGFILWYSLFVILVRAQSFEYANITLQAEFKQNIHNLNYGNHPPQEPIVNNSGTKCVSCVCGERNENSRIVGGRPTDVNEYPWVVSLWYFNRFFCGGTLINDRYVLTAAHCVAQLKWFLLKIKLGTHNRCINEYGTLSRYVLKVTLVPAGFNLQLFDNDIALLQLNERVPFSQTIKPVCLPKYPGALYIGSKAVASGWGYLQEGSKLACVLQKVELPVISNTACKTFNYAPNRITNNMLCAGYPEIGKKDSCQGDSGGPLVTVRLDQRYEIIGIVSWGEGCARIGNPGIYSRITRYLNWIWANTQDACYCQN